MRVGTRGNRKGKHLTRGDHPHACGDKRGNTPQKRSSAGSSPCVWGQDRLFTNLAVSLRIIPMRVGTRFEVLRT